MEKQQGAGGELLPTSERSGAKSVALTPSSLPPSSLRFDLLVTTSLLLVLLGAVYSFEERRGSEAIFLRDWLILAGIPVAGAESDPLELDWLQNVGGEAGIRPRAQMALPIDSRLSLPWNQVKTASDTVVLLSHNANPTGITSNLVGYAYGEFEVESSEQRLIAITHDDEARVWINGALVFTGRGVRPLGETPSRFPVELKAGANSVLVKVTQGDGGWGFSLRIEPKMIQR